jgi:hypothetical protein
MAELDSRSALLADRQNAIERGFTKVLRADGPHPETFAAERAAQPIGQNVAENIGIRGRVDRMFGTGTQRDAVTLDKLLAGGEDGYAAANLKTAFGEQPVNKLLDTLSREKTFANTTQEVIGNSATSGSKAAGEWLKEGTPGSANLNSANLTGVAMQTAKKWIADPLVSMILRTSSEPMRAEMANVLTMQGQTRDQVVSKLLALHSRQNSVSAIGGAISNATNLGANRLIMGASGTMRPNSARPRENSRPIPNMTAFRPHMNSATKTSAQMPKKARTINITVSIFGAPIKVLRNRIKECCSAHPFH